MGKIVSLEELKGIVAGLKREGKRIVTTNGTFDILHSGHVYALEQSKALGDVLIVGLNSDASVKKYKGPNRPINNQNERAILLASLECVDYVAIFDESRPTVFLEAVRPHVHTKSGDYDINDPDNPINTYDAPIVKKYGGEVRIVPYVKGRSTTYIIKKKNEEYEQIISNFSSKKVLVVGDVMLDKYVWGKAKRISPEAPIPVVVAERESFLPGGAANVANNIAGLGARAVLAGIAGDDAHQKILRELLEKKGVEVGFVLDDRPTTTKVRVIAHKQQLLRCDYEQTRHIGPCTEQKLLDIIKKSSFDAIIVSDYAKGTITQSLYDALREIAREKSIPVFVDVKPRHRVNYAGATVTKTNYSEALELAGVMESDNKDVNAVGELLVKKFQSHVVVTRAEKGVSVFGKNGQVTNVPTMARQVSDVSGAGDTFLAALALSFVSGASLENAASIANHAAGIKVGKIGAVPVLINELREELQRA